MKSIKKITVFYTDGTFEDIEKTQTFDIGKITNNPNPGWSNTPPSYTHNTPVTSYSFASKAETTGLTTQGIAALTTSQISSFTKSGMPNYEMYDSWGS